MKNMRCYFFLHRSLPGTYQVLETWYFGKRSRNFELSGTIDVGTGVSLLSQIMI